MTINHLTALIISKGYTLDEGLKLIGKSRRTYYRWLADDVNRGKLRVLIDTLESKV